VRLFERHGRGLVPTKTAEKLAVRARQLLGDLTDLERGLRAPPLERRVIRMVCECYTAYHWLPSTLKQLREQLVDLDLRIRVEHTVDPLSALEAQKVDAALLTSPCSTSATLKVRSLMTDEIVFLVSRSHPLADKESLTPLDLEQTPLFTQRAPTEEARWFMRAVFGRRRPRLDITTVPLTEAVVDFASAGMGIAILTEWVIRPYVDRGGYVAKRLDSGPLMRSWRLAWRAEIDDAGPRLYRALHGSTLF
ncbi:MAG: substrate-binding domain-containing protein, partial [Myxococcota bacterium]